MNKRPLLCMLAGFVLGEVWIYQFHGTAAKAAFSLVAIILIVIAARKRGSFFLFLAVGFLIGGIREYQWIGEKQTFVKLEKEQICYVEGQIEEKKVTTKGVSLVLNKTMVNGASRKGKVVVYPDTNVNCYLGSTIKLKGKISGFNAPTNPGEFDQKIYQEGKGILGCMYEPDIIEVRYGGFLIKEGIIKFREKTALHLESTMKKSQYAIAMAMVLGDKTALAEEEKALFETGGISHILAVSGLHMTLIGAGIYKIFRKIGFSYTISVFSSFPCVLAYAMMTGMSASCLRASIMLIIYLIAEWKGLDYDLPSSLSLSGLLLLGEIPSRLFDSGFLLSFGAMIGVGIFGPFLLGILGYFSGKRRIRDSFLSGFLITIFTLPLSLYFFYGVSAAGLILNLIVIPLMSALVPLLSVGGISWLSIFPDFIGKVFLSLAGWVIDLYRALCQVAEYVPGAYLRLGHRSVEFALVYYMGLFIAVFLIFLFRKRKIKWFFLSSWFVFTISLLLFTGRQDTFLTILDVGQGDGMVFHGEKGEVCMIDGGSSSKNNVGKYIIEPAFKYYGISKVDYWFVSHMDGDHTSGVKELLEQRYPIKYLILPDLKEKTEEQMNFEKLALLNGTQVHYMSRGEQIKVGNNSFHCIHPKECAPGDDVNQNSLVLLLDTVNQQILLTGDVEKEGEEEMSNYLKKLGIDSEKEQILKVAHHGSANGTGEFFLDVFHPEKAVVSCGKNNRYGHPAKETVERIENIGTVLWNTAVEGAIEIRCGTKAVFYKYGQ